MSHQINPAQILYPRQGPCGPRGAVGPQGPRGLIGPTAAWRDGSGAPSDGLGNNGDYYLDDLTGDVYTKSAGTYSIVANITGPTGAMGDPGSPAWANVTTNNFTATGSTGAFTVADAPHTSKMIQINLYLFNVSAIVAGAATLTLTWNDGSTSSTMALAPLNLALLQYQTLTFFVYSTANVNGAVVMTGVTGSPQLQIVTKACEF